MKSLPILPAAGILFLAGCTATNLPYHPKSEPEKIELSRDSMDVYPNDVRQDPARYDGTGVAWAGIIRSSQAEEFGEGMVRIRTTLEHHYFDWEENRDADGTILDVSPRGEGLFQTEWVAQKVDPDATADDAQKFAAPGKLAIVYGATQGVADDGAVKLKYRYLRVVDKGHYATNEYDYGRFGEPVVYLK